jgi:hypothetical protein
VGRDALSQLRPVADVFAAGIPGTGSVPAKSDLTLSFLRHVFTYRDPLFRVSSSPVGL